MAESDNEKGNGEPQSKSTSEQFTDSLREAGLKAAELAKNPVARNMFAAGLVTAAAALTANKKFRGNVAKAGKEAEKAAASSVDNASKIGAAIIGAATDAVRKLMGSEEETLTSKPARKPAAKKSGKTAAKKAPAKAAAPKSKAKSAGSTGAKTAPKAAPKPAKTSAAPKAAPKSRAKKAAPAPANEGGDNA